MKICSSALHRGPQLASGKNWNHAASGTLHFVQRPKETLMLKTMITVATVLLTTAAFAQSDKTKSPGSSEYSPGHKMQKSKTSTAKTSTAPGASEYAPGHKMKKSKTSTAPGASEYAPGQQTTTGSAATDRTKKK